MERNATDNDTEVVFGAKPDSDNGLRHIMVKSPYWDKMEVENESKDPEQALMINLPAGTTSFEVPASMLAPDSDYQVGVGAVSETGNIVFSEAQFSTSD